MYGEAGRAGAEPPRRHFQRLGRYREAVAILRLAAELYPESSRFL